ncbi:hypothetical protein LJC10_06450 [Selenomonadales bacterium OttesenSCG-928-I06]|nr:hypothetical protein [Selenomonadales bacterium OttesenSCG-928-I06]
MNDMRIYITVILILIILTGLLTGCGMNSTNKINDSKSNISHSLTDSPIVEIYENDIEWLSFSFTDYEEERALVRNYFAEDIARAESDRYENSKVKIAIAKANISGDSKPAIVFILVHKYFSIAPNLGNFGILVHDGNDIKYIVLPYTTMFPNFANTTQRNFGIVNSQTSEFKDFYINGNLWKWSGERYTWISETAIHPNKMLAFIRKFFKIQSVYNFPLDKYYLDYNILEFMKDGMEDTVVSDFYQQDIKDVQTLTNRPIKIKYFDVDLNDDGLQDKIVIISSSLHSGSAGDAFRILINDGNSYVNSCYLTVRLMSHFVNSNFPSRSLEPYVRILTEKKDGFRSLEVFFENSIYQLQQDKIGKNEYIKVSNKQVTFRLEYKDGKYNYVECTSFR